MKILLSILIGMYMTCSEAQTLRIATFNVSMEATNYVEPGQQASGDELFKNLATGTHPQIVNIAAVIQHIRPDIILLNEFDFTANTDIGIKAFIKNYLNKSQRNDKPIDYLYFYTAPVNTGVDSGLDLDKDGIASGKGGDAFGFGFFPGHYGMALLSRYPIDKDHIRTFQHFLWRDMPGNLLSTIKDPQGKYWFNTEAQKILRLSSKSHWDVPVNVNGEIVHILASHPTPPVFDGPENRNGKRNHDEVRFWNDYLEPASSNYIYDDAGKLGGLASESRFVILGDLNSSAVEGDGMKEAITTLIHSPRVMQFIPRSEGGKLHAPDNANSSSHTADWRMRADYVLPAVFGFGLVDSGVFWPTLDSDLAPLVQDRQASSDHRLVWVDVVLENSL